MSSCLFVHICLHATYTNKFFGIELQVLRTTFLQFLVYTHKKVDEIHGPKFFLGIHHYDLIEVSRTLKHIVGWGVCVEWKSVLTTVSDVEVMISIGLGWSVLINNLVDLYWINTHEREDYQVCSVSDWIPRKNFPRPHSVFATCLEPFPDVMVLLRIKWDLRGTHNLIGVSV
jgi:hypothetical protein